MTFDQYWGILLKRWKLIVICFVVIGFGTFIGSKLMTPIYQSAATIRISISAGTSQADINNLLASDQLVQTEAQLATSYQVLSQVATHYPGLTVDELAKNVTAVAVTISSGRVNRGTKREYPTYSPTSSTRLNPCTAQCAPQ